MLRRIRIAYNRFMSRRLPIWLFLLFLILGIVAATCLAAMVRYQLVVDKNLGSLGNAARAISEFPSLVKRVIVPDPPWWIVPDRFPGQHGVQRTGFVDDGYLLLGVVNGRTSEASIKLVKLADGSEVHSWKLFPREIERRTPTTYALRSSQGASPFFAVDPRLMADGGVVFGAGIDGPLVKIDQCSRMQWVLDIPFHHAIEIDADGNIWANTIMNPSAFDPAIYPSLHDDGIAKISPEGKLLYSKSVAQILVENGYRWLVFGVGTYEADPIHLNETYPAMNDSEYWRKGDLLISSRNKSTIFIYRPSDNKIIWLKTGPWMNQHAARFVGNSKVSVYGNDVIRGPSSIFPRGHNTIYVYDLGTNEIAMPYDKLLGKLGIASDFGGQAEMLSNGDVIVIDTVGGRPLRISPEAVRWSYVNRRSASDNIGIVSGMRYMTASQMEPLLARLNCGH